MKAEWEWRFMLSWLMREIRGKTQAEKGDFLDDTIIALQARERGANAFADKVLDRADALSEKQANNGRGNAKDRGAPASNHGRTMANHGRNYDNDDDRRDGKNEKMKTENEERERDAIPIPCAPAPAHTHEVANGEGAGSPETWRGGGVTKSGNKTGRESGKKPSAFMSVGDKPRYIRALPSWRVIDLMAEYCAPEDEARFVEQLRERLKRLGDAVFKNACGVFVSSVESNGEPTSRSEELLVDLQAEEKEVEG